MDDSYFLSLELNTFANQSRENTEYSATKSNPKNTQAIAHGYAAQKSEEKNTINFSCFQHPTVKSKSSHDD